MRSGYLLVAVLLTLPFSEGAFSTSLGNVTVSQIAGNLDQPWAIGFLPGGEFLVTERDGTLIHFSADGRRNKVSGLPKVRAKGQGGLLDVMIPRDFARNREVFLSYSKPQGRSEGTAVGVGTLSANGERLQNYRDIFVQTPGSSGGRHFGSRIVEGRDGYLYVTIGDRADRMTAQDLSLENGSVIRIRRDGAVPASNPFTGQSGAKPQIWSYGHRNPQGAALDGNGDLWVVEHGAQGGDEINRIRKGANYGWPVISYGTHYSGQKIGEGTSKAGMEQPEHYWDPSVAPSGMMIYSGKLFPEWRGDIFVGSLKFDMISRLEGDTVREAERLEGDETIRVRDIREAPDGSIWFLSVGNGALFRMAPPGR